MEELWLLHYNRLVDSFDKHKLPPAPKHYIFFKISNFIIKDEQKKKNIIRVNGVRYRRSQDEDLELAKECNIDVRLLKKIKQEVYPLYKSQT